MRIEQFDVDYTLGEAVNMAHAGYLRRLGSGLWIDDIEE
jgi:hypothetical protein